MARELEVTTHVFPGARRSLALVIPTFNERRRLPTALSTLQRFASSRPYLREVIVVDDGSHDGTAEFARSQTDWPLLRVIGLAEHREKGAAVRAGILAAEGVDAVAFSDVDLAADITLLDDLLTALKFAELAIASRGLPNAKLVIRESALRESVGRLYAAVAQVLLLRGIPDAHCGLKMYRLPHAREIFRMSRLDDVLFDLEVLLLATERGYRIAQLPAIWRHDRDSRMRMNAGFAWRVARDMLVLKARHRVVLPLVAHVVSPSRDDLEIAQLDRYAGAD